MCFTASFISITQIYLEENAIKISGFVFCDHLRYIFILVYKFWSIFVKNNRRRVMKRRTRELIKRTNESKSIKGFLETGL